MVIVRPASSRSRALALNKITTKNNSIPIPQRFFTSDTTTRMNARQIVVKDLNHDNAVAKRNLSTSKNLLNKDFGPVVILFKYFIEGLFKLTKRTDTAGDVALYNIAVGHQVLPKLSKQEDIALWGEYLETGEADRMALAGRVAMSNPSIADVMVGVNAYGTKKIAQSGLKDALENTIVARKIGSPATDIIIKKAQDEVQVHFGEGTDEEKRMNGREFGLVWISKILKTFNIIVLDDVTGLPIDMAIVELIEASKEGTTGPLGTVPIKSYVMDLATFNASHDLY